MFSNLVATASQIDTVLIESKSMHKSVSNLVITPDSYHSKKDDFPVLYLLHGVDGDYLDWINRVPEIREYADMYNLIIVCPDGGSSSWYFNSTIDKKSQYETYIAKELVVFIDKNYNTVQDRKGRAITGLSMGGHGAFYLAFKHQDIWGAAGSMSGGLDFRAFPKNYNISKRLGAFEKNKEIWERNTVINMICRLKGDYLKLIFDCGIDDFFYDANIRMHKKLTDKNIPHDYIERPGNHDWEYWANSIKYQLVYFDTFFKSNN
jgi:S-formylglutathione hydrolase FrmB